MVCDCKLSYKYMWVRTLHVGGGAKLSRNRSRCRAEDLDVLLMNFELVDLVLKRVEVDLSEPPLAWGAGRQWESGFRIGRDRNVSATLLFGGWVRSSREFLGMEMRSNNRLDGKLDARRQSSCCLDGRCRCRGCINVEEMNVAWSCGKDRVILADRSVRAWMPRGATLPEDDLTGIDVLAGLLLITEAFTGRIAVVFGGTTTALGRVTCLDRSSKSEGGNDAGHWGNAGRSDGERSRCMRCGSSSCCCDGCAPKQ